MKSAVNLRRIDSRSPGVLPLGDFCPETFFFLFFTGPRGLVSSSSRCNRPHQSMYPRIPNYLHVLYKKAGAHSTLAKTCSRITCKPHPDSRASPNGPHNGWYEGNRRAQLRVFRVRPLSILL